MKMFNKSNRKAIRHLEQHLEFTRRRGIEYLEYMIRTGQPQHSIEREGRVVQCDIDRLQAQLRELKGHHGLAAHLKTRWRRLCGLKAC